VCCSKTPIATVDARVYSVGVEPSGRFVYVGSDFGSITVYSLDRTQSTLTVMAGRPFPLDGLQPEMVFVTLAPGPVCDTSSSYPTALDCE